LGGPASCELRAASSSSYFFALAALRKTLGWVGLRAAS
jgi:hypothetical protein